MQHVKMVCMQECSSTGSSSSRAAKVVAAVIAATRVVVVVVVVVEAVACAPCLEVGASGPYTPPGTFVGGFVRIEFLHFLLCKYVCRHACMHVCMGVGVCSYVWLLVCMYGYQHVCMWA